MTIYYVDNAITDTHVASATPDFTTYNPVTFATDTGSASVYKTIADINACTFSAGDQILFRKGQTWRETLIVPNSGSSGNPITFGAYGTGIDPIITGANAIGGTWTQESGAVSAEAQTTLGTADVPIKGAANNTEAQGIISDSEIVVPYIDWYLRRSGTIAEGKKVWIEIWSTTLSPTRINTLLYSSDQVAADTMDTSYAWIRFNFASPPTLSASTQYILLINADYTGSDTNKLQTYVNTSGGYRSGDPDCRFVYLIGTPPTWSSTQSTHDGTFNVYKTSGSSDVYSQGSITTEPFRLFYRDQTTLAVTELIENDGATTGVGANEWDWASNTLYVNLDGADPNDYYIETNTRTSVVTLGAHNYLTFDGLTITQGSYVDDVNQYGNITGTVSQSYLSLLFQNCDISYSCMNGFVFWLGTPQDCMIDNCHIHHNNCSGYRIYHNDGVAGHEWVISNCEVDNNARLNIIDPPQALYIWGNYHIIENNIVHDNGNIDGLCSGIEIWDGFNEGFGQHHIVRYNIVYNQKGGTSDGCGIFIDERARYCDVYYNICYNNDSSGLATNNSQDVNIYNNVCYNNGVNSSGEHTFPNEIQMWGGGTNINFKNNIMYNTRTNRFSVFLQAAITNLSITNNIHYCPNATNWYSYIGTAGNNLATWNGYTGIGTDLNSNPLMVDPANGDFHLQAGSPCINAGVDVSLTEDYEGNVVPQDAIVDIGAYEYQPIRALLIGDIGVRIG